MTVYNSNLCLHFPIAFSSCYMSFFYVSLIRTLVIGFRVHGFSGDSDDKESACNAGDLGSIPGLGSSPGEGYGNSL